MAMRLFLLAGGLSLRRLLLQKEAAMTARLQDEKHDIKQRRDQREEERLSR